MPVFRVEKTSSYTVMSNHHLRNPDLTLKAKGLLSLMLSLPENWDYTLKGLSCICQENVDAICTAVQIKQHLVDTNIVVKKGVSGIAVKVYPEK